MKSRKKGYWYSLIIFLAVSAYWLFRTWKLISFELVEGEDHYLGNLMLYLLSWFFVFLIVNLLAYFNFRYVFLRWREFQINGFVFWTVELGILALFFEFLQWLSQHELQMMKDNFMLTLIVALYFLAFTWFFDMVNSKRKQDKLLQQKERAELMLLQSQLNPHFLFNALNTTYSTAMSERSEKTAQQILQISDLMRFALEKSNKDFISIEEEVGFLEKYIQLQKDRFLHFGDESIQIEMNWDGIDVPISPMLIQPFLENAFKFTHFGVTREHSTMKLKINIEAGQITLLVDNYYLKKQVKENKGTGKGIHLVKQRLKSLYPQKHHLVITDNGKIFKVYLRIDLKE